MGVEIHCDGAVFSASLQRRIQHALYSHTFDPMVISRPEGAELHYVDRVDVAPGGVLTPQWAEGAIDFKVNARLDLARRSDVLAAPMKRPEVLGVSVAITLSLQIEDLIVTRPGGVKVKRTFLLGRGTNVNFGLFEPLLGNEDERAAVHQAVLGVFGTMIQIDLLDLYQTLGLGGPPPERYELALVPPGGDSELCIRFDPDPGDPAQVRLLPGQQWGLWLPAQVVGEMAVAQARAALDSPPISLRNADFEWAPQSGAPGVDLDVHGLIRLPQPFAELPLELSMLCVFGVPSEGVLRTWVKWSFDGFGVPGGIGWVFAPVVEAALEAEAQSRIEAQLRKPGGNRTVVSDDLFYIERPLPTPSLAGLRLSISSVQCAGEGMTLGGLLTLPFDVGHEGIAIGAPQPWSRYAYVVMACAANPPHLNGPVTPDLAATGTQLQIRHMGTEYERVPRLDAIEHVYPGDWLQDYLSVTADNGLLTLSIDMNAAAASLVTEPVRLIVRAPRGVRLIQLPPPPPVVLDEQKRVVDSWSAYIDLCPVIDAHDPWRLRWGRYFEPGGVVVIGGEDDGLTHTLPGPVRTPPGGGTWPGGRVALTQVLNFKGLEPGELLQFRSADHDIIVSADREGQAWMPVLLGDVAQQRGGELARLNGRALSAGSWRSQSATLQRTVGAVPAAHALRLHAGDQSHTLPGLSDVPLALRPLPDGSAAHVLRLIPGAPPLVVGLLKGPLPSGLEQAAGWQIHRIGASACPCGG